MIHNGLLYHRDQVEGQSVSQLCVPKGRRDNVLRLAHESVFGGHLGEKPGSVFDFHFIGLVYVSPCCHMYSLIAVVNYSHDLS